MRVAAVTMMFNEALWAPVWAGYYARELGAENCLVLDHGTDDGSLAAVAAAGVRVERMPRSALDEDRRAALVSDCVAVLLRRFDAVIHTDADELLLPEPRRFRGLIDFAAAAPPVCRALGLDLQHLPDEEPPLDPARPIGQQRGWTRFSGAMCKPALVKRPVRWTPGFHGCDAPAEAGAAFLLHLRYADLGAGLQRLRRTRELQFAHEGTNPHQRVSDDTFDSMMRAIARLPREEGLEAEGGAAEPWMARMRQGWARGDGQLSLAGDVLWALPGGARARF